MVSPQHRWQFWAPTTSNTNWFFASDMKSAFPKIAAVVFTIASVAMMGMSLSAYFNRLDYVSQMSDPLISDYKFESTTAEGKTSWTVTPSTGDDRTERRKDSGYAALQEAYQDKSKRSSAKAQEMEQLEQLLSEQKERVAAEQEEDLVALDKRIQQLTNAVTTTKNQYLAVSQQHQKLITESQEVRAETADRREDVIRLTSELEELRTDRYRLKELRRDLTDRFVRLQLENQAMNQRLQQINQQLK